ncbi:transcriptional regulator, TetR family [Rhodovulum sp. ES.010]|nr:transcriptional regulator, TetR family [Rhodovulum sp. ES.010]
MNVRSYTLGIMARTSGSHSEITGPRLRKAAQRLFAQQGYAAVSMRQIAAEVGVQAGALYNYIPDKQGLLFDLMESHLEELLAAWSVEPRGDGPLAALEAFTRFHIRFHLDRPDAVFIAYMELRNLERGNFAVIEALRKRYETELEDILKAGKAAGVFRLADSKLATLAVIAMLTGVTTWYRDDGRLSRARVEEVYWDIVRQAVGA